MVLINALPPSPPTGVSVIVGQFATDFSLILSDTLMIATLVVIFAFGFWFYFWRSSK